MQNRVLFYRIPLAVLLLVTNLAIGQGLPPLTHQLTPLDPVPAPHLMLHNMDDEMIDLAALRGRVVVVNFWATWCPPCRREMGSLERLHQATKDHPVVILAVNIGEDLDTVFSFLGTVDPMPSFPMLLDQSGDSMPLWQVRGLPTTFVVDTKGRLAYRAVGGREFDHPQIVQQVLKLVETVE